MLKVLSGNGDAHYEAWLKMDKAKQYMEACGAVNVANRTDRERYEIHVQYEAAQRDFRQAEEAYRKWSVLPVEYLK